MRSAIIAWLFILSQTMGAYAQNQPIPSGSPPPIGGLPVPGTLQALGLQIPASCDAVHAGSGNMTAGSDIFQSPQAAFTSTQIDGQKTISVEGAAAGGATLVTTVASVIDSTHAKLNAKASTTVVNASFAYGSIYTQQIQNAINSGVPFHIPPTQSCGIDATLNLPNNTTLAGYGGSPYFPPTSSLVWLSASPGPALLVDTGTIAHDINLSDFSIFGMCALDTGAMIKGLNQSTWYSIHILDATNIGFHFDISADGNYDNGNLSFGKLQAGVQNLCARNQRGVVVEPGNAFHDFTRSSFTDLVVQNVDGTALDLYGMNSTIFVNTRLLNALGGTGKSIEFHGAAASPAQAHAIGFFGLEASGQIQSDNDVVPAQNNFIWVYDVSTFATNINTQAGASLYCISTLGGGDPGNGCTSWKLFASDIKTDNSAGTAGVHGNVTSSGTVISGGQSLVAGGRLELYGSTFGVPNSGYFDVDRFVIRKADTTGTIVDINPITGAGTITGSLSIDSAFSFTAHAYRFENSGGTATMNATTTSSGVIFSGGNSINDGANIELYGSTAASPNNGFFDANQLTIRSQDGSSNRMAVGAGAGTANGGVTFGTGLTQKGIGTINVGIAGYLNNVLSYSSTAPTIASGGCTTGSAQSVSQNNGTAAFEITLGGATCGSTITLTLPAASHNWVCDAHDVTTPAGNVLDMTGAPSTTAVVFTNFSRTTGVATNFTAADKLAIKCTGY